MIEKVENILRAFNYDAKVALEQYLIACEIDNVEPDEQTVKELDKVIQGL